jgi:cytochrome c oxidase accessory protein FixG
VLFDLPARQFHIFGLTFWPQDFPLLAWLLIIAAFALFTVTVWAGRVWCGYTCPQTVWTAIYMWAEQFAEGSRNQRMRLDAAPWRREKIARKLLKHGLWLGFAALTGFTFVGYFSPIRDMALRLPVFALATWEAAWIVFFTSATYINAGWLREQVCLYMCPYARFQSVMFDRDTLIVSYDSGRGEPRGSRKKGSDAHAQDLGDCIDCQLCVQVCPTGIDIRNGLQYQCINCALCIDACDSVMDKMGYTRGLIRYTTENALAGRDSRWLRPRLAGYAIALAAMTLWFAFAVTTRVPLHVDVLRERQHLYRQTSDGLIENTYTLRVMNMDTAAHEYRIKANGLPGATLLGPAQISVNGGDQREFAVRLSIDPAQLRRSNSAIEFEIEGVDNPRLQAISASRFIGPRGGH